MTPDLAVEWITGEAEFEALREPWNRLVSTTRRQGAFLRHEWFDAAWQWRKDEHCLLRIALVSRGVELVGICPLVLQTTKLGGLPVRRLDFLSVPDTQFCDLVCDNAETAAVCATIMPALKDRAREWDVLELKHLPDGAAATGLLEQTPSQVGIDCERTPWDANAYIDLTEGWDAFYGRRSRSLKKANNLAANRLRKAGELEIQWLRGERANPEHVDALLEEFVAISARSWKAETGLTLENAGPGAFIRRLTRHAMEQGWLSMWGLRLGHRLVAMEYQLIFGGDVFALRADFDQSLETVSPGSYLNAHLLKQLFASGLHRYWLGPGPNPYKARWTEQSEPLFCIKAYSPTARGHAHRLNERLVRPAARNVLGALRRTWRGLSDPLGVGK